VFQALLEPGDVLVDGGNEWFENSVRRAQATKESGIIYMAMGISGGEEGARNGPSLMPGGPKEGFDILEPIITKSAAQTDSGSCTAYLGGDGAGNYVKMVHNGIEYGDMQLIAEAYEILKSLGGFNNEELADIFEEWNKGILDSFLIEITGKILRKKDDLVYDAKGKQLDAVDAYLVDNILDRTGNKGTGKMTIMEGANKSSAVSTMAAALDMRFISFDKDNREKLSKLIEGPTSFPQVDKEQLKKDVEGALYCSKICSYAQGMNLIRTASDQYKWNVNLGECARIWTGGCIIRAAFLKTIKAAYDKDANLPSLLVDPTFREQMQERQSSWRNVVALSAEAGLPTPALYASLGYFDAYRRAELNTSSLVQAQRDFFGSHTFERKDKEQGVFFHCKWTDKHAIAGGH